MKETIRILLVEDEDNARSSLKRMLEKFCKGIEIVGEASNVKEGVALIHKLDPDLVFLDIEMPEESGLELFTYFERPRFRVIFTTAYGQYAIKAIRMAALDYLLKPIDLTELRGAVERYRMFCAQEAQPLKTQEAIQNVQQHLNGKGRKIAIANQESYEFIDIDDIIRCEAEGSYTLMVIKGRKEKIVVSRNLKEHTNLLEDYGFLRVHRSHLINRRYVKSLIRTKTPTLIMQDNAHIPVISDRKDDLFRDIIKAN